MIYMSKKFFFLNVELQNKLNNIYNKVHAKLNNIFLKPLNNMANRIPMTRHFRVVASGGYKWGNCTRQSMFTV